MQLIPGDPARGGGVPLNNPHFTRNIMTRTPKHTMNTQLVPSGHGGGYMYILVHVTVGGVFVICYNLPDSQLIM